MKQTVDWILFIGLGLYVGYIIVNRFFVEVPDIIAYPWAILSCVCMLVGIYRSAKKMGEHFRKR